MVSDFEITMRDWKRLCDSMNKKYDFHSCEICPVHKSVCGGIWEMSENTDWKLLQEKVTAWAAENPEPQYPTWGEWLMSIGVINGVHPHGAIDALGNLKQPIPADIAEKLGLKPKGGNEDCNSYNGVRCRACT